MRIGHREFEFEKKSYIMGILNVTPDSFSDGGRYDRPREALKQARKMIEEGAAILDVGGESTRPGHSQVDTAEEIRRVLPVIKLLKEETDAVISLDTWKYEVARAGLEAGADMINDIWGLRRDRGQMASLIAETGAVCCLMHNRQAIYEEGVFPAMYEKGISPAIYEEGAPIKVEISQAKSQDDETGLPAFIRVFCEEMEESLRIAREARIREDRIILDPGIGFGKSYEQNLMLMKHLAVMKRWKQPVLLGTSRKSMIGITLDLPVHEREEGTLAATVIGRMAGASLFRVHNVKANKRALQMADAIIG